jgi:hypothetical protein
MGQGGEGPHELGMVGGKGLLIDGKGALQELAGGRVVA